MYGLPQAGLLGNELIAKILAKYFFSKQNTSQDYGATKSAQYNFQ